MTSLSDTPPPVAPSRAGKDLGLVDALAQLSFLVHNALAEIAAQHDLSIIQTRLLGVLRDREPTMNALGRHLGLDKSSISGLVDRRKVHRADRVACCRTAGHRPAAAVAAGGPDRGRRRAPPRHRSAHHSRLIGPHPQDRDPRRRVMAVARRSRRRR